MRHDGHAQRFEYRVVQIREGLIGGALSGDKLEAVLNDEAREFRWVSLAEALALPINAPTRLLLEAVAGTRG